MQRPLVGQKFGGSSVADADRIRRVARRIARERAAGSDLVVIVSAMGDTTDELLSLAAAITDEPDPRELDMLLATGEHQSATLMSMALHSLGVAAVSLTGPQARGTTPARHGALGAVPCQIFPAVRGISPADPRVVPAARQLPVIGYEEMLELAHQGAQVMQVRAVELGWVNDVVIEVLSSFEDAPGTLIKEDPLVEQRNKVRALAHDRNVAKVTLVAVPDRPGVARTVFEPLAEAGINVDMIVQNVGHGGATDMSLTAPRAGPPPGARPGRFPAPRLRRLPARLSPAGPGLAAGSDRRPGDGRCRRGR